MDLAGRLKVLGQVLRGARNIKKWTLVQLSDETRLSTGYLSNLENGYVNPKRGPVIPSDETIALLSKALDLPIGYFHEMLGRTGLGEMAYIPTPSSALLVERYNNADARDKKIVDAALGLDEAELSDSEQSARRAAREGTKGQRPEEE